MPDRTLKLLNGGEATKQQIVAVSDVLVAVNASANSSWKLEQIRMLCDDAYAMDEVLQRWLIDQKLLGAEGRFVDEATRQIVSSSIEIPVRGHAKLVNPTVPSTEMAGDAVPQVKRTQKST